MKRVIFLILFFISAINLLSAQDLPSPPANLQTVPQGSYIIPMGNTYQSNTAGLFNLKAYGLLVYLLNNNKKIKWAIRAGKAKDGIDFTATAQRVKPSLTSPAFSADFKGGPFIIYAADITGVDALIDAYYTANSLTGNDRPNVYQTTADVTVDIRYNLSGFLPKAAILTDGGNQAIHIAFMTAAGIPSMNYTTSTGSNLIASCFTFASEPHNSNTGSVVDVAITDIRNFVVAGGNFLAQCAAIPNYENNSLGRFQTTTGITVSNTNISTTGSYANPDLSFSQFEGVFNGSLTGSVKNWQINASGSNNEHNHYTGSGAALSSIGASVSKLKTGIGGLAFYLGNHNFSTSDLQNVNGIRMYMNAFLTPALTVCGSVVPLKIIDFNVFRLNDKAQLKWSVAENETGYAFEIEKSLDGNNFLLLAQLANTGKNGNEFYQYADQTSLNHAVYYRLKLINLNGSISYSKTVVIKNPGEQLADKRISVQSPFATSLNFSFFSETAGDKYISLYNLLGQKVFDTPLRSYPGSNIYSFPLKKEIPAGIYLFKLYDTHEAIIKKIVRQ
ncbi:MAG: hypothetical protein JWM28_656 [Chitinophagaceae bacterium]|nr:hypothetical protein [Chitinophagaceae bacterium]